MHVTMFLFIYKYTYIVINWQEVISSVTNRTENIISIVSRKKKNMPPV